ncbi:MAG: hypothetical protein IKF59_07145, partial [Lachnospiraceae bacterium]|nr:hypothetical protein [Lachnospiraceae bacterium]
MGKRKPSESLTVNAAARFLGIQPSDMQAYIDAGRIISTDGRISRLLLERLCHTKLLIRIYHGLAGLMPCAEASPVIRPKPVPEPAWA